MNLQYITSPREGMSLEKQVESVLRGGVSWVQLRLKDASKDEFIIAARSVKKLCQRYNATFIINDNVDLAKIIDADGVHLGKDDMDPLVAREILGQNKIIGATCNTWEDIENNSLKKVDYIGLGPFAFTTTKKNLSPVLGLEFYKNIVQEMQKADINIPIYAIGGIKESDISPLLSTGVKGIALSSLIKDADDIEYKTKKIIDIIK